MKKIIFWTLGAIVLLVVIGIASLKILEKNASEISIGKPIERDSTEKSALLVIDIQGSTTGEQSLTDCYKQESDTLIQRINRIILKANQNKIPIIYIRNEISNWFVNLLNNSMEKGSAGAAFDKRLMILSKFIIPKEKNDAFSNPRLDSILNANKVNKLFIVGLDAAYCVNSTILAATNRAYKVSVITDALVSESDSLKNKMLNEYLSRNVELLNMKDFLDKEQ